MKTHLISFNTDGTARCLWTEVVPLHTLGRLEITRASQIEFSPTTQQWEVRDLNGHLLHANPSRNECLEWEAENLA